MHLVQAVQEVVPSASDREIQCALSSVNGNYVAEAVEQLLPGTVNAFALGVNLYIYDNIHVC